MRNLFLLSVCLTFFAFKSLAQPVANFNLDVSDGCAPLEVQFTDESLPTGEIVSWLWSFGGFTLTDQNPTFTFLVPGTYEVCLTVTDASGLEGVHCVTDLIVVYEDIVVDAGTDILLGCEDPAFELVGLSNVGGPNISYQWTDEVGGVLSNTNTVVADVPGIYTFTATDNESGCSSSDAVQVFVDVPPIAEITVDTSCFYTLTSLAGLSGLNQWYNDSGELVANNISIEVVIPGVYTLVVTDFINSCTATSSVSLGELESNPITLTGAVQDVSCSGGVDDGVISTTISGGESPFTYFWSTGANSPDISGLQQGTYSLTVYDNAGCFSEAIFVVGGVLDVDANVTDAGCNGGQDGTISLFVSGGVEPYAYNWSDFPSIDLPEITGLAPGSYVVTVEEATGCFVERTFQVGEATLLTLNGSVSDVSCFGGSDGAIDISVVGGTGGFTFEWSNGSLTEDQSNLSAGTYSVTVTDINGCERIEVFTILESSPVLLTISTTCATQAVFGTATLNVTGGSAPYMYSWQNGVTTAVVSGLFPGQEYFVTVTDVNGCQVIGVADVGTTIQEAFGGDTTYCEGSTVQIGVVAPDAISYFWQPNDNLSCNDCPNPTVTASLGNQMDYAVTVTEANGCFDVATINFNVQSYLDFGLLEFSNSPVLAGEDIVFECNVPNANSVIWSGPAGFNSNLCDPVISNATQANEGAYTVDIIDQYGCAVNATTDVIVQDIIMSITADTFICLGDSLQLEVLAPDAVSIQWSPAGILMDDPTSATPTIWPSESTLYSVVVEDADGNAEMASVFITVDLIPVALSLEPIITACYGEEILLCADPSNLPGMYFWSSVSGEVITPCLEGPATESETYWFTYTSPNGCSFSETIEVTVADQVILDQLQDDTICRTESAELTVAVANPDITIFEWAPSEYLSCTDCPNPVATLLETTTFFVTVTEVTGCIEEASFEVVVLQDCVWPGDTNNDFEVNNVDLLNIGLAYDSMGPIRTNATLFWTPQRAGDWNGSVSSGVNYKHIDSDGDGLVNADDTLGITLNWGSVHQFTDGGNVDQFVSNPPIGNPLLNVPFYIDPDTLIEGASYALPIILGDEDNEATDVYGLAFTLEYDTEVVTPGSASMGFGGWIGNLNNDMIAIQKTESSTGKVKVGLTRIDGLPMTGFGEIGQLYITIEDDILFHDPHDEDEFRDDDDLDVYFNISDVMIINNLGEELPILTQQSETIIAETVGNNEINWDEYIQLSPNPASDVLNITAKNIKLENYQLFSITGSQIRAQKIESDSAEVVVEDLTAGIYLLEVVTEIGVMVRKIIVE